MTTASISAGEKWAVANTASRAWTSSRTWTRAGDSWPCASRTSMPGRWIVPSSVCRLMPYVPRPPNVSSWCLECIVGAQMILAP